mmetsp:Transcript_11908/g.34158  ORF Transcript_11908/g.34158 Transcript_11908/m.34158 type:complete len:266 (+) Transcript_11908:57-854(+)
MERRHSFTEVRLLLLLLMNRLNGRNGSNESNPPNSAVSEQHSHAWSHVFRTPGEFESDLGSATRSKHNLVLFSIQSRVRARQSQRVVVDDFNLFGIGRLPHVQNVNVCLVRPSDRRALPLQHTNLGLEFSGGGRRFLQDDHSAPELLAHFLVQSEREAGRLTGRDTRRVDTGNVSGLGDGLHEGPVVGGSDVDVCVGTDIELTGIDKARHNASHSRNVEDVVDEVFETAVQLSLVLPTLGQGKQHLLQQVDAISRYTRRGYHWCQ